ncbi:FkbM family methyltransferase [Methylobacter sp. G7]|uniref:FkbM family methyltransferase n=1 Tax=Methylobacter sp. G7 TaxID=3230117 RepID=UPI003D8008FC
MKPIELPQEAALPNAAISVKNLGKCYQLYNQPHDRLKQFLWRGRRQYFREFWALRDVSFEVMPGEVLGIIGRNGSGKSTLLQLVCGTLTPTSGEVAVKGRVAALLELGAGFNPEFSGRENVFMSAAIMGLSSKEIEARYEDIVDFSGIRDFIDQPVKTYSSGMYVRLAFSVAINVDPDILVIDEALSVGDGEFARKSFDRIRDLKKAGKTILFCSHSLYQVEAFCDRVLWLDHGDIKLFGNPQETVQGYSISLLGGAKTESAAPSTTTPPAISAPEGYARLCHVEVSLDGEIGSVLRGRPDENDLSIRLQFESDPQLPAPTVGVTISYGTLMTVACVVSRSENVPIERDQHGRGEVTIDFPALPLRKGEYLVAAYLGNEDAVHIYDSVQIAATLQIEDPLPEPGLVNLVHHWHTSVGHSMALPPTSAPKDANWQLLKLFTGRPFWVDRADSLQLAKSGMFEPLETALLRELIKPGDKVLDIGANMGYYTVLFADWVGASGIVHAVEPDPDNFALLDANTRDFQQQGRVHLHTPALSESSGTAKLFHSKDNVGMHRLYDSICCDGSFREVVVCRGDDLALAPLDVIKIDIEGYEAFALRGLSETLTHSPNLKILCEFSPLSMMEAGVQPLQWLKWMESFGFIAIAHNGTSWSPVVHDDLKRELNCLDNLDFTGLTSTLKTRNNDAITDAAIKAAAACGYPRPILENLLLVRPQSLQALTDSGIVFNFKT